MRGYRSIGFAVLALVCLTAACQAPTPAPRSRAAAPQTDALAEARAAMVRHEYDAAARWLRGVVATRPDSLEGHFRLGVSASYLDLLDEATHEFQWVVKNAPASSEEAKIARDWLRQSATEASAATPAQPAATPNPELATLSGVVTGGDGFPKPLKRHKLSLKGMKPPVLETAYDVRTDYEGRFSFPEVKPGEYMLTDMLSGTTQWRLRVTLNRGDRTTVDLTPDNGIATRDDFPDGR